MQRFRSALPLMVCASVMPILQASPALDENQPAEIIDLWPGSPPGPERSVGAEADVTRPADRLIAGRRIIKLANVATPQAHIYLPSKETANGTAIVVCPGGGYSILAWDLEGTEVADWLNSVGVAAIVLKYRVPTREVDPKWLQPVQDAQRTISIVRHRAQKLGIHPQRIGILGFSAGGDTAVRTALADKRYYERVDESDEASSRPDMAALIYPGYLANSDKSALHDDLKVTSNSPPMFLVHAFDDPVPVESSLLMAMALKRAGVPSELHMYDAGGHGYGLRFVSEHPVTLWPQRCEDWLRRNSWVSPSQP